MRMKQSSGNVFRDLGFPPEQAANLKIRSKLMVELKKHIRDEKLTQKQAAKKFGVSQTRISDLFRGKIALFSVDTLISMLTHAGLKVDVKVRRSAAEDNIEAGCQTQGNKIIWRAQYLDSLTCNF